MSKSLSSNLRVFFLFLSFSFISFISFSQGHENTATVLVEVYLKAFNLVHFLDRFLSRKCSVQFLRAEEIHLSHICLRRKSLALCDCATGVSLEVTAVVNQKDSEHTVSLSDIFIAKPFSSKTLVRSCDGRSGDQTLPTPCQSTKVRHR